MTAIQNNRLFHCACSRVAARGAASERVVRPASPRPTTHFQNSLVAAQPVANRDELGPLEHRVVRVIEL
jgi:hypothetical protein